MATWSEEEDFELRRLWTDGFSASQIARALGSGRSRNAVIGRVHRLGLVGRATKASQASNMLGRVRNARMLRRTTGVACERSSGRMYQSVQKIARQVEKAAAKVHKPEPIEALNVPFAELQAFQCKAITDATRFEQKCCGLFRAPGSPYCEGHKALHAAPVQGKAA